MESLVVKRLQLMKALAKTFATIDASETVVKVGGC